MRRIFKSISIFLLCGMLCCPISEARGRNDHNNGGGQRPNTHQTTPHRPGNSGRPNNSGSHSVPQRPANSHNNRPGNNGNHNNQGIRPGNNGNHNNQGMRPGNNGNHSNQGLRPGNNGNRPGNNFGHGHTPNRPNRPNYGHNPAPSRPVHNIHHGIPHRPMMPPPRPYARPVPPPRFTPFRGPSLSTILGVALGTTLNYALNQLVFNGYNVTGYGNDAIYLSNVNQLNMIWPNATMFYSNGMLSASEFVYSTPYYDLNRYNSVYNMLTGTYGMPATSSPYGNGGMVTRWWGSNGQYISLSFSPMTAANGTLRYYTTLSFGN